jgi:UDP-glucuronate decarboxylase
MEKTIIIAGGAGFLGRHLCKYLLNQGHKIICVDNLVTGNRKNIVEFETNPFFRFIEHDITELLDIDGHVDEIYNMACIASPDKYKEKSIETLKTCFIGNDNLLQLANIKNAKFLLASTSEVYGDPLVDPQPETYYGNVNPVGERSCYDEGKRVSETLVYEYRKKCQMDAKIVRIFNTYGPYMDIDDGRVITNFIKQYREKNSFRIYGNGQQTRSFCYVDDLVNGLVSMMESRETGPINLGNPYCKFTMNQLVGIFEKITGEKSKVVYLPSTENDPKQREPVIELAKQRLGFDPQIGLEEGLMNTIKYFESLEK